MPTQCATIFSIHNARQRRFYPALAAVVLIAAGIASYFASRPDYSWDIIPYAAVAELYAGVPRSEIHDAAYDAIRVLPDEARRRLTTGTPYAQRASADPVQFMAQLPFYTVRPLYPLLMCLLHGAGIGLVAASLIVTAISYACIAILLFLWFARWAPAPIIVPVVALLMLNPTLTRVGQLSSPDMLAAALILFGAYLGFEQERFRWALVTMLIAILARTENIIYVELFCGYLALSRQMAWREVIGWAGTALCLFLALTKISHNYGWRFLFYFNFISKDINFGNLPHLDLKTYISIYIHSIDYFVFANNQYFAIFAALGWGALWLKPPQSWWTDRYVHLLGFAVVAAAIRFVILPDEEFRALLPAYLIILVAFVQACCALYAQRTMNAQSNSNQTAL